MRYVIAIGLVLILLGSVLGVKAAQLSLLAKFGQAVQQAGIPPESVATASAAEKVWQQTLAAVGSVVAVKGVTISADVPGIVSRILFQSGTVVHQGQPLVMLDTRIEQAQLASLRTRLELAETTAMRSRTLLARNAIAQAQVDADEATLKTLKADVDTLVAQIDKKTIRAPFTGRLGLRLVNLGQYLAPGSSIAALEDTDSAYVDFTLPQQSLSTIKTGMAVRLMLGSSSEAVGGTISALEPAVDLLTRTVKVRATIKSPPPSLRAGMFVRIAVILAEKQRVVVVPVTAVVHASYGDSVFVVEPAKTGAAATGGGPPAKVGRQQFVRLGETRGDFIAVREGLRVGEEVVVAGAFKLRNGAPIVVNNKVVPEAREVPQVPNR